MKNTDSAEVICAPTFPHPSHDVIKRLRESIRLAESPGGLSLHEKMIAKLVGIPKTTFNDWGHNDQAGQITRFLAGIERLSDEQRLDFLQSVCRHCPRLDDPCLSHDRQGVALIRSLVLSGRGISLITGTSIWARSYLLRAIGNSFAAHFPMRGFDFDYPVDFVPVPGIFYPARQISPEKMPSIFAAVWPAIAKSEDSIVLLNGVREYIPGPMRRILDLANKNLLFIGGSSVIPLTRERKKKPINIIYVESIQRNNGQRQIHMRVEIA